MKLHYGMILKFPCHPIEMITPLGAMVSSSSPTEMVDMEVCKYWEDDTDANRYKVTLKPIHVKDKLRFGYEKLYSSDLLSLINQKTVLIVNE